MPDSPHPRSDAMFRALLEAVPDAMVIVNAEGTIELVNARAEELFGYDRHEMLGRRVEILVPSSYQGAHAAHRAEYLQSASRRPTGGKLELFGLRKDGSEFPAEICLSQFEAGRGMLVASAIRDITGRKAAEAEHAQLLQERTAQAEANRIKDEFLATLAHELRTPLNAVLGWIGLIDSGAVPADQLQRALVTISRNARVQAQLVDDLLDVSRILSGKLKIRMAAVDLTEIADAALDVVRPDAEAKVIDLQTRFDRRPLLLTADADRLQQIIWNLLSNAIRFTPPRGRVELHAGQRQGSVEIVVVDTGQGISPAFVPHVFDRFRQADSSTTRPHGGLGLGLAIARSIAELHGGSIEASSPGLGGGATFRVRLPVGVPTDPLGPTPAAPDLSALRDTLVLIVDDQADERALLAAIFGVAGATVQAAADVDEAFRLMAATKPHLVVSDLAMPGKDGYALVRRLREDPVSRDIPALAVTAHVRPEDRDTALAAGFDAYVAKPLDRELLLSRAATLLVRAPELNSER